MKSYSGPDYIPGVSIFDKPEDVDVYTAIEMIRVGIAPTTKIAPVGSIDFLHGDIPIRYLGQRTREQFLGAIKRAGLSVKGFSQCPAGYLFEAFEAVNKD